MATYTQQHDISVPMPDYEATQAYYEVQNVAAAFLHDYSEDTYTDYTDEANDAVAGDVPLLPSPIGVHDGFLVGGAVKFDFVTFDINTAGTPAYATVYYYWNGSAWIPLAEHVDYIYDSVGGFQTAGLVRFCLKSQPDDWAAQTIGARSAYYLRFSYSSGGVTVYPVANQIWLGTWSQALTAEWSDTMAIDDTQSGQFLFDVNPAFSDNMAIDDTQPGQFAPVVDFVRSWSDLMDITDLTDSQGMQFQINVVFADVLDMGDELDMEMLAKYFARSWSDVMAVSDALAFDFSKILSDVVDITDDGGLVFNFRLNMQDIMEIVDLGIREWGFRVDFHDIMTIVDSILWRGDYPAPVYLRFSARRPQITIYTKAVKKQ